MSNNYVLFPMRLIEETVQILKGNGAKFVRSADYWPKAAKFRTRADYLREFAEFHTGSASNLSFAMCCASQLVRRQLRRYATLSRLLKRTLTFGARKARKIFLGP